MVHIHAKLGYFHIKIFLQANFSYHKLLKLRKTINVLQLLCTEYFCMYNFVWLNVFNEISQIAMV